MKELDQPENQTNHNKNKTFYEIYTTLTVLTNKHFFYGLYKKSNTSFKVELLNQTLLLLQVFEYLQHIFYYRVIFEKWKVKEMPVVVEYSNHSISSDKSENENYFNSFEI